MSLACRRAAQIFALEECVLSANAPVLKERNTAIQLIRVAACLMVFTVHFGQRMGFTGALGELTYFGKYGVELSF